MVRKSNDSRINKMKKTFINSAVALILALLVGMVIIALLGYSPLQTYSSIFGASLGTIKGIALSLSQATPLIFTGMAFALAFKVKMINTGAEGQLYAGAMGAALVGAYFTGLPSGVHAVVAIGAAFLAGGLVALFVAIFKVYLNANEVILSLILNNIIIYFTSYLANGPLRPEGSTIGQTQRIAESAQLSRLIPQTQLTTAIILAIIVAAVLQWTLKKTVFGYEVEVTGKNANAAHAAGVNVNKTNLITFALSGAIAGLGGAAMVLGVNYRFIEGFSPNFGFAGISIAALAAYNPIGVLISAILIGILKAGTITLNRTTAIPVEIVDIIQVLILIFVAAPILISSILGFINKIKGKSKKEQKINEVKI